MIEGPAVCIFGLRLIVAVMAYHPPIVIASGMMTLRHLVEPGAWSHTTDLHALEHGGDGEIDIEADALRQAIFEHLGRDVTDIGAEGFEVGIFAMVAERKATEGMYFIQPSSVTPIVPL